MTVDTRFARRASGLIALVATLAVGASGCSSSKSASTAPSSHPSSPTPTTAASGTPTTAASSIGTGTQPADAATVAAVTRLYTTFFNPNTPVATTITILQDGPAFSAAVTTAAVQAKAQKTSASVSAVALKSPNTAVVTFTLSLAGTPVAVNQTGYAVRENGTWKMAGQTFCGLLSLQGTPPATCQLPAATELPN
jgi:hypothetical protein